MLLVLQSEVTYLSKATCDKLICCKTGLKLGGFNSFCSNFAEQVARFTEMKWVEIPVNLHLTHLFVLTSLLDLTSWVSPIEGRGARDTKGACSSSYKKQNHKKYISIKNNNNNNNNRMYTMRVKKVAAPNMASLPPKKQKPNETVK